VPARLPACLPPRVRSWGYGRGRGGPEGRTASLGHFITSMSHVLSREPAIFVEAVAHSCALEVGCAWEAWVAHGGHGLRAEGVGCARALKFKANEMVGRLGLPEACEGTLVGLKQIKHLLGLVRQSRLLGFGGAFLKCAPPTPVLLFYLRIVWKVAAEHHARNRPSGSVRPVHISLAIRRF